MNSSTFKPPESIAVVSFSIAVVLAELSATSPREDHHGIKIFMASGDVFDRRKTHGAVDTLWIESLEKFGEVW